MGMFGAYEPHAPESRYYWRLWSFWDGTPLAFVDASGFYVIVCGRLSKAKRQRSKTLVRL